MNRIVKILLLCFIFLVTLGTVFWGMQWFAVSVHDMLIHHNNFLQSSLETSIDNVQATNQPKPVIDQNLLPLRDWQQKDLVLDAPSAISIQVSDDQTRVLFKKNEEKKLPIASLTKLMTALVVFNNYDLSQKVTISEAAMAEDGEQGVLKLGDVLTVKDLLYITLMESSNRAAYALSEVAGPNAFVALMNANAQKMGLKNTHFQDATGLGQGSYSTVEDVSVLSIYLFEHYPLFKEITGLKEYDLYLPNGTLHHKLINTNKMLGGDGIVSGKTGFTAEARGCFMAIQKSPQQDGYIINIVLGAEDRFLEMKKMIDWIGQAYKFEI